MAEHTHRMAVDAAEALKLAISLTKEYSEDAFAQVQRLEDQTDEYEDALGTYMMKLSGSHLSHHDSRIVNTLLYSISDLERIADHTVSLAKAGKEMADKGINFSDQAKAELAVLEQAVLDVMARTVEAFQSSDLGLAMKIEPQEQVIDSLVREVKSRHIRRLRDGKCTVEYGFVLDDLLTSYERIADHCSNVAVEMIQSSLDKMDAHEYLNALKAGELEESEKYNQRLEKYTARYTFPEEK